ncbi:MAG: phosphoglycerate kinase [Syntrophomonadaceae bacterium]
MQSLKDADLNGKTVLMRVDFNVPMDKDGNIIDDTKIRAALPSIEYVINRGAKLIVMSHLGRPKGKPEEKYSMKRVAEYLAGLVNTRVKMANESIGQQVQQEVKELKPGEILVLENVRFHAEEEKNDKEHARQLAALADIFVNDAFGSAHRAHASTAGVAEYLPAYAGFLLESEVGMLRKVLDYPESPRMAILGGAKVADKLGLIENLCGKMDLILIGGGMANTFLKAQGKNIGLSKYEPDLVEQACKLLEQAPARRVKILLPVDAVVATEISPEAVGQIVPVDKVPDDCMILDIGPETIALFAEAIAEARTIVWNGPLGVYEYNQFAQGTREVARAVADSGAVSVIGGGDSAAAVHNMGLESKITHISTGGGATLEFLEGQVLPGVAVVETANMPTGII